MTRRSRIPIVAAALVLIAGSVTWFALGPSLPPEPVYNGRPLLQWLDGTARANGASKVDLIKVLGSMGPEALPWLIHVLEFNQSSDLEKTLYEKRLHFYQRKTALNKILPDPYSSAKERLRFNALSGLSHLAVGTRYEKDAARVVLKSRGCGVFALSFDELRLITLARLTNCQSLVLPELLAGVTNNVTGYSYGKYNDLRQLAPAVGPTLFRIALTEPDAEGPAARALHMLDTNLWAKLQVEKPKR